MYPNRPDVYCVPRTDHAQRNGKPRRRPASSQRFDLINNFMDCAERHLRPAERQVWLHLWRLAQADNTVVASFTTLEKRTGLSRWHVSKAIASLQQRGLLLVVKVGQKNHSSTRYRLRANTNWSPTGDQN